MVDAVLSPHAPWTCGTAKWSQRLAEKLRVPFVALTEAPQAFTHPLLSTRLSELPKHTRWVFRPGQFDLFVHDLGGWPTDLVEQARTVYAANRVLARQLEGRRPDVIAAWCPSSLQGNPNREGYRVLTFGMAHKIQRAYYERLKAQLDREHSQYTVSWTCAVHDGRPWEADMRQAGTVLREVFGDKLRILGSLADDGLAKELQDCDAVALFFPDGVRENNTTAWAALEAGKPLVTNRDEHSPDLGGPAYSWDGLLQMLGAHVSV